MIVYVHKQYLLFSCVRGCYPLRFVLRTHFLVYSPGGRKRKGNLRIVVDCRSQTKSGAFLAYLLVALYRPPYLATC
jgi:hypothetical protein